MTPEKSRAANKKQYMRRIALGLCRSCGGRKPAKGRACCPKCLRDGLDNYYKNKEKRLDQQKRYKKKLRDATFAAYGGPICACCGETRYEFLQVDHVNGDGADHRRKIGKTSQTLYLWLRKHGYPKGFRVLCVNCNFSMGIHGYCPHEKERRNDRKIRR